MAANAAGQSIQAEAQIRCKTSNSNSNGSNASNNDNATITSTASSSGYANVADGINALPHSAIANGSDPRRQSTVSAMSPATTTSASMDSQLGGLMPNCVVDSHIPHMICMFTLIIFFNVLSLLQQATRDIHCCNPVWRPGVPC